MELVTSERNIISPLNLGTCVSYELCGDRINIRFLGLILIGKIELKKISTFRLASRGEPSGLAFLINLILYYLWRPAHKPIYLVRTSNGKSYFIKLSHDKQLQFQKAAKRGRRRKPTSVLKKAA